MTQSTEEINERDTSKAINRDEQGDVPRSWRPSTTTMAAITGENTLPPVSQEKDVSAQRETDAELEFRQEMASLDSREKGRWGERAVVKEAEDAGHMTLVDHFDKPTERGFDCVSFDPVKGELHIWEAKNWESRAVDTQDLTAWQDQKNGMPREGFRDNWDDVVKSFPEGSARDAVKQAINEGKVTYHLRLGPDTKITPELQKELDEAVVPGAKYDWQRYSYDYMMRLGSGR